MNAQLADTNETSVQKGNLAAKVQRLLPVYSPVTLS